MKKLLSILLFLSFLFCLISPVYASKESDAKRIFGDNRYDTAFKVADELKATLGVDKFENVIVASGTGFADALAGSYLAANKSAPIIMTNGKNVKDVHNYIKNNLFILIFYNSHLISNQFNAYKNHNHYFLFQNIQ